MDHLIHTLKDAYRRYPQVAAYAVFGIATTLLVTMLIMLIPQSVVYAPTETGEMATTTKPRDERYLLKPSEPQRILIPKLNIDAQFETPLGLKPDRTVEVPKEYTTVGWYTGSPTPGELGPSIILGHVDSYEGAAIFYNLGTLVPGDTFQIERADGSRPTFVVESLERYPQSDFPTDKVYGPIDHAGIRLITCSGTYDKGSLRYSHNLVVYGRLVNPLETPKEPIEGNTESTPTE